MNFSKSQAETTATGSCTHGCTDDVICAHRFSKEDELPNWVVSNTAPKTKQDAVQSLVKATCKPAAGAL